MKWARVLQRHGYPATTERGEAYDPFWVLAMQAKADGQVVATVSFQVHTAVDYNQAGCKAMVSIACPQAEASINMAGELAFRKAVELANDGASHIGIPQLPDVEEP